ncbi:MAG: hypothetical protein VKL41_16530 [Snowella sp.]|nr:hypothetical protein [Snowella sp.]
MGTNLHFYKFKLINEEFTPLSDFKNVLAAASTLLKNMNLDEEEELQKILFEEIETDFLINSQEELIYPYLKGNTRLLDKDSTFYLVDDDLWQSIKTCISRDIENDATSLQNENKVSLIEIIKEFTPKINNLEKLEDLARKNLLIVQPC